jgi:hypothetical protein
MAKTYLFTSLNSLKNQESNAGFGYKGQASSEIESFKLDSTHNLEANSPAYAIKDGVLMIQPNNSSEDSVNVILFPKSQTDLDHDIIKYFVYRGIKKSSIFNNLDKVILDDSSDLKISLKKYYSFEDNIISSAYLGYGNEVDNQIRNAYDIEVEETNNLTDDDIKELQFDNIFYGQYSLFQHIPIKAGESIGVFNQTSSICIYLGSSNPKVEEIRANACSFETTNADLLEGFELENNKRQRRTIRGYLDILSYYSIEFQKNNLYSKSSNSDDLLTEQEFKVALASFTNSNKLILDVTNEFNLPFDFYTGVASEFELQYVNIAGNQIELISNSVWPIILIEIDSIQEYFTLKIPNNDSVLKRIYISSQRNKKVRALNFFGSNPTYSEAIKLNFNMVDSIPSHTFVSFSIIREVDENIDPTSEIVASSHIVDSLFDLEQLIISKELSSSSFEIRIKSPFSERENCQWLVNNWNKVINIDNDILFGKVGSARDFNTLYLFSILQDGSGIEKPIKLSTSNFSERTNFFDEILFENGHQLTATAHIFNGNYVCALKKRFKDLIDENKSTICLGLDNSPDVAENDVTKLWNCYTSFRNNLPKQLFFGKIIEVQNEFFYCNLFILGYDNSSTTNDYELKKKDTGITLYFHDKNQLVYGTSEFNRRYYKDQIELNKQDFFGFVIPNLKRYLRTEPDTTIHSKVAGIGMSKLEFLPIAKFLSTTSEVRKWYKIFPNSPQAEYVSTEVHQNFPEFVYLSPTGVSIGCQFPKFLKLFKDINDWFDSQTYSNSDSVSERITRLRMASHNGGFIGQNFNALITSLDPPLFKNDLPENSLTDQDVYDLQLFKDIEIVDFADNLHLDIHHLLVGVDVINHINQEDLSISPAWETVKGLITNKFIEFLKDNDIQGVSHEEIDIAIEEYKNQSEPLRIFLEVALLGFAGAILLESFLYSITPILNLELKVPKYTNIHTCLYSGDAGSIPPFYDNAIKNKTANDIYEFIHNDRKITSDIQINEYLFDHFSNSFFSEVDQKSDLISFLLNNIIATKSKEINSNTTQVLIESFKELYLCNNKEQKAKEIFFSTFEIDNLNAQANNTFVEEIQDATLEFAKIFRFMIFKVFDLSEWTYLDNEELLSNYSNDSIYRFIKYLNSIKS